MDIGILERALWVLRSPAIAIELSGGRSCRATFESFTARHPRYPFTQRKRWGVALLEAPLAFDGYLAGRSRQALRTNRRRALEAGMTFQRIEPLDRLDEVLAINRSMKVRQGRKVDDAYLDVDELRRYFQGSSQVFGVTDRAGVLVAYLDLRICGPLATISRLLGEEKALDQGVMYLLISDSIGQISEMRRSNGTPRWVMYDTFFGASSGLRYFKERLGFAPYRVTWAWNEDGAGRPSGT
jgi:hypothetical protein